MASMKDQPTYNKDKLVTIPTLLMKYTTFAAKPAMISALKELSRFSVEETEGAPITTALAQLTCASTLPNSKQDTYTSVSATMDRDYEWDTHTDPSMPDHPVYAMVMPDDMLHNTLDSMLNTILVPFNLMRDLLLDNHDTLAMAQFNLDQLQLLQLPHLLLLRSTAASLPGGDRERRRKKGEARVRQILIS